MRYGIIDARSRTVYVRDFSSIDDAHDAAGLDPMQTDHGIIGQSHSIIVYQFGLFQPRAETTYFTINGGLYAGSAVIYRWSLSGASIPVTQLPPIKFMDGDEALAAVEAGDIARPCIKAGGRVIWQWPDPRPTDEQLMG